MFIAAGAAILAGYVTGVMHFLKAEMASVSVGDDEEEDDILQKCKGFMSMPVTDVKVLQQKKCETSTKMEMLIMETQAAFCRALEKVDGGKFKVDRWEREEGEYKRERAHVGGGPGTTCGSPGIFPVN